MMIILCTCVGAADTCNGQTYDPSSYICTYISGVPRMRPVNNSARACEMFTCNCQAMPFCHSSSAQNLGISEVFSSDLSQLLRAVIACIY